MRVKKNLRAGRNLGRSAVLAKARESWDPCKVSARPLSLAAMDARIREHDAAMTAKVKANARRCHIIPNPFDHFLGVIASEAKQSIAKSPMLPMDRHGGFAASR
jgi:hypothetical protein